MTGRGSGPAIKSARCTVVPVSTAKTVFFLFRPPHYAFDMAQTSTLSADWAIHTVPADVWRYTFVICYRNPFRATSGVVRLGHVCRTWRTIVHGAPELWTNVSIKVIESSEGPHITPKPELLPIILSNSGAMPLKMSLTTFWYSDEKLDDFIDVAKRFFQATRRARYLNLYFFSTKVLTLHGAEKEIRTCDILQDLRLGFQGDGVEIIPLISELWSSAPFLRSFRLTEGFSKPINLDLIAALETSSFPFHQLTVLAVESRISVKALFRILPSTPSLISATLTHIVGEMDEGPSKDLTLQALESLTMEGLEAGRRVSSIDAATQILHFALTDDPQSWVRPRMVTGFLQNFRREIVTSY